MRLIFPSKVDTFLRYLKLKLLPNTLFFRTMLLIIIPLIVVQVVSIFAYFNSSWGKVGKRLADNLSSNMAFVVTLSENNPSKFDEIKKFAKTYYDLDVDHFSNNEKHVAVQESPQNNIVTGFLENSLEADFPKAKTHLFLTEGHSVLVAQIDIGTGLYQFSTSTKNIFSSSIFGFIAWMIGTSLLLFIVSSLFLRIQARSIKQLAEAAEDFGKGVDTPFKPYGSAEVRKAGIAFTKMKERIKIQMSERTQMLAGVSHDLRTPLTRMKLQLAMESDDADNRAFLDDVNEMEQMLNGYLSFARGEGVEESKYVDMKELVGGIINKYNQVNVYISYQTDDKKAIVHGREQALKRAITNIISNALYYGKNVAVKMQTEHRKLKILIDDDGPGIPKEKREDVFKAFYRIEGSRNKKTGGVGLGLSIAKDIVVSHGGTIELSDSDLGGLRVIIKLPL